MKKLFIIVLFILIPSFVFAAGTVSQGDTINYTNNVKTITLTCVGDSSSGSIPDTALRTGSVYGWKLYRIEVDPGATAPTADSDIYINDANGLDLLDGNGVDLLSNTTTKASYTQIDGIAALQAVTSVLTLDVDSQSVASATYTIILTFVK